MNYQNPQLFCTSDENGHKAIQMLSKSNVPFIDMGFDSETKVPYIKFDGSIYSGIDRIKEFIRIWNEKGFKESSTILSPYGKELILDLHECDPQTFTRDSIEDYFKELCDLIDMERCELYWWDDYGIPPDERETKPHLKGTSAVQFIITSNITIHTLDLMKNVYLNIFSCKDFDPAIAKQFSEEWFKGKIVNEHVVVRV